MDFIVTARHEQADARTEGVSRSERNAEPINSPLTGVLT
jgi:hypothetical protein